MKSYYGEPIGTYNALSNGTISDLYGLPSLKIGGSQPHPKTAIAIISGTAKATDGKFGRYIHRVHPNTNPWKILEKRERGRIQGLPNFVSTPYCFRNG